MVMELKLDGEARIKIDLPVVLRRQLARRSLAMGIDLPTLIYQILQQDCCGKEYDF